MEAMLEELLIEEREEGEADVTGCVTLTEAVECV